MVAVVVVEEEEEEEEREGIYHRMRLYHRVTSLHQQRRYSIGTVRPISRARTRITQARSWDHLVHITQTGIPLLWPGVFLMSIIELDCGSLRQSFLVCLC